MPIPANATAEPRQTTARLQPETMRRRLERKTLGACRVARPCVGLAGLVLWVALPAIALAQDGRFSSTRTQSQRTASAQSSQARAQSAASLREQNRHLLSGLGSGANAAPGWYSRNLSQPVVEGGAFVAPFVQPLVPLQLSQVVVVQQAPPVVVQAPPPQVVYVEREHATAPDPRPVAPRRRAAPRRAPAPDPGPTQPPVPASPPAPRYEDPQSVHLQIAPADAVVHLDDERIGTGAQIPASLHLEPGVHVLEVSHPVLPPQRLVFGVADEAISIAVDLTADRPSRRARVR